MATNATIRCRLILLLLAAGPGCERAVPPPSAPAGAAPEPILAAPRDQTPRPDIFFLGTPQPVVDAMLELADVKPGDVLYDLGSGDGRIPITAAKRYGIRAVGIEIDPQMVAEARANARAAGVSHLVTFVERDLFLADVGEASVVTLYLLDRLNLQLRPKLLRDLAPGSRIVSHQFGMGDWRPEATRSIGRSDIYLWRVPASKPADAMR